MPSSCSKPRNAQNCLPPAPSPWRSHSLFLALFPISPASLQGTPAQKGGDCISPTALPQITTTRLWEREGEGTQDTFANGTFKADIWLGPCRWEAVIVVMDSAPFHGLAGILNHLNDDRIWVYAEWIGRQFAPKVEGVWSPSYHQVLYDLTDEAIRACSSHTRPVPLYTPLHPPPSWYSPNPHTRPVPPPVLARECILQRLKSSR